MRLIFVLILFLFSQSSTAQKSKKASCYDLDQIMKVEATPLYKPHLVSSKSFKIDLLENTADVQKYINNGKLKSVNGKMRGYRVQKLGHSRPYLTYKAKLNLEKLGNHFANETKSYFTVTSITRTLEDQCNLRKVNKNVSLGISSHNYGNSFDISYKRFDGVVKHNPKLEKKLEETLEHFRKMGRIHYIKEKQQACYHVTVRNY